MKENKFVFKYWDFIENYYPNYYSCDNILLSDVLHQKLNGQEIDKSDEDLIKNWNKKKELLILDTKLFRKALESYFEKT